MDDENDASLDLTRAPTEDDLVRLAATLNDLNAKYVVIGGMAMVAVGFTRATMDIDLLVESSLENEARVLKALESLPERAGAELIPGEISQYIVVRVCDEFTVDLMAKACGISYEDASPFIVHRTYKGISIPFASPLLLWKTKQTYRDKDAVDRAFLQRVLEKTGDWPVPN